jgi:putative glutamine amidotransferase
MADPSSASVAARIVVTVAAPATQEEPALAARKNGLYAGGLRRHGAEPIVLDASSTDDERAAAFATMDGLLLSGGADLDPERYGQAAHGARALDPERDALEAAAWGAAAARGLPVFGICRGFQVINVLLGGSLIQHVDDHEGASFGHGPAATHPLRIVAGTRLARILFPTNVRGGVITVNTYHHQGVRGADLAPGLVANAWAASPAGELVEGFESESADRFLLGVQCHPERTESTPAAFERVWRVFANACRGPLWSTPARQVPSRR